MGEDDLSMNPVIVVVMIFSLLLPIGLLIWWKKKTGEKLWCFVAGAICFVLFVYVLENLVHQFMIFGDNDISELIVGSPVLFTIYGSLAAGIFEETGRLFGFKVLLRNHKERECAVAYGIGHGGIEVLLVLGMTYLLYFLSLVGVQLYSPETNAQIADIAKSISAGSAAMAMFERISAMMLHIGLSMIMFFAVRQKGRLWLYPVSIFLHALADVPACLYQYQVISSIAIIEIFAFIMAVIGLVIGVKCLNDYRTEELVNNAENGGQ